MRAGPWWDCGAGDWAAPGQGRSKRGLITPQTLISSSSRGGAAAQLPDTEGAKGEGRKRDGGGGPDQLPCKWDGGAGEGAISGNSGMSERLWGCKLGGMSWDPNLHRPPQGIPPVQNSCTGPVVFYKNFHDLLSSLPSL